MALIICGIVILLLIALLFVRIKFDIMLEEEVVVRLNILGIKISIIPSKEKKVKIIVKSTFKEESKGTVVS